MNVPLRAIIVEDDYLLSETLADGLASLGYQVLALAATVQQGLQKIKAVPCDFVIVDLSLKGEMALSILDDLCDRGIPFLLATGTCAKDIPERHMAAPRLFKPYDLHELQNAIESLSLGAGNHCPGEAPRLDGGTPS